MKFAAVRCSGRLVVSLLFLLLVGPGMRLPAARASWGENYGSVHFNSGEPDFGTPPRRAVYLSEDSRPNNGGSGGMSGGPIYTEFQQGDVVEKRANTARLRARLHNVWEGALARGEWRSAKQQIKQEMATMGVTGSLRDRAEVLDAALNQPAVTSALGRSLRTYFRGLRLSDDAPERHAEAAAAFQKVLHEPAPDFLRVHSLYQLASLAYQKDDGPQALRLYEQVWRNYPHAAKKPAALLMTARAGLLLENDLHGQDVAKSALDRLRREFPQSRYQQAVPGLYGRYWYLKGNYGKAADIYFGRNDFLSLEVLRPLFPAATRQRLGPRFLATYLYGMERATNYNEYIIALKAVDRELQELTPEGAKVFVRRLLREPDLAAPYFYYRLYYTDNDARYDGAASPEQTRKRIAVSRRNLLRLAGRVSGRAGGARLPAPVRLRLAEVYYQEHRYPEALAWVQSVLDAGTSPKSFIGGGTASYDRALYVRGAIYQKQRQGQAATADFNRLLTRFPNSVLRPAAREELALLYEAAGRNVDALDQYFALRYDQDVAYLLDVRMSTDEVAAYCAAHPRHRQSALLMYSLGVRYLRDDDLSAARQTLNHLSRKQYTAFSSPVDEWGDTFNEAKPTPLQVVDALVTLRQQVARARTREARARALYREASYQYKNGLLLFYNAALWRGRRVFDFDVYWNRHEMTPADRAAIRQHMYQHEVYVRVIKQCRQIADGYPGTSAAPLALYRAACASERLSSLNQWWDAEDSKRHFNAQAANLLRRLAQRYPHHPLGHNARKYAVVFAQEENAARQAWAESQKHEWETRAY